MIAQWDSSLSSPWPGLFPTMAKYLEGFFPRWSHSMKANLNLLAVWTGQRHYRLTEAMVAPNAVKPYLDWQCLEHPPSRLHKWNIFLQNNGAVLSRDRSQKPGTAVRSWVSLDTHIHGRSRDSARLRHSKMNFWQQVGLIISWHHTQSFLKR